MSFKNQTVGNGQREHSFGTHFPKIQVRSKKKLAMIYSIITLLCIYKILNYLAILEVWLLTLREILEN